MDKEGPGGEKPTVGDVFLLDNLAVALEAMEDLEKADADKPSSTDAAKPRVDAGGLNDASANVDASEASGGDGVPADDGAGALEFNIQVGGAAGGLVAPDGDPDEDEVVTTIDVKMLVQMLLQTMINTQNAIAEDGQPRAVVIPQEYFDAMVQHRVADDEESTTDHERSQ